jgi:NAD-dependent SIR2 family protein deacetylase
MTSVDLNNFFIYMLSALDDEIYVNHFMRENANVVNIRGNIREFLIDNCDHEVETDYIDLTPDQSQRIVYCAKCKMTL